MTDNDAADKDCKVEAPVAVKAMTVVVPAKDADDVCKLCSTVLPLTVKFPVTISFPVNVVVALLEL